MVKKKRLTKSATKETFWGWIFVFPTMIGLAILNFYPMIYTVYQSFFKTGDFGGKGFRLLGQARHGGGQFLFGTVQRLSAGVQLGLRLFQLGLTLGPGGAQLTVGRLDLGTGGVQHPPRLADGRDLDFLDFRVVDLEDLVDRFREAFAELAV